MTHEELSQRPTDEQIETSLCRIGTGKVRRCIPAETDDDDIVLSNAITHLRADVERLTRELAASRAASPGDLAPEIVEILRDVASGPCTPDLRGRAGAALVRRDLVEGCARCGGSGYERIGDGSVNAWGACEACRLTVRATVGGQTLADLRARVIGRELGASPETCLDVGRAYLASEQKLPASTPTSTSPTTTKEE